MSEIYLKRFAVFFTLLLILQECNGLLKSQLVKDGNEVEDIHYDGKSTAVVVSRQKRVILDNLLLAIGIASSSIAVYKNIRGCKDAAPGIEKKFNQAKSMQKNIIEDRDRINLAWVPAESKCSYAQRLSSDMNILKEQLAEFDRLQVDLLRLLDQNLLDNMNLLKRQLENDIDANKDVGIKNFAELEARFFSTAQYALNLTNKLLPLGFLSDSDLLPKITAKFARNSASEWYQNNPGRVQKIFNSYSGEHHLRNKRSNYKKNFPRTKAALGKLSNTGIGKSILRNIKTIKSTASTVAKSAIAVLRIGVEVWNLIKFIKACKDRLNKIDEAIDSLTKGKKELNKVENKVKELQSESDKAYRLLKNDISCPEYLNYVREVADLGENAKDQTTDIVKATKEIKRYTYEIKNADLQMTDKLNKMVTSAFGKINSKLECLRSKLAIVTDLIYNCGKGRGKFDDLYQTSKDKQNKITDQCINGNYMNKNEVHEVMKKSMKMQNKQLICIRNSQSKKRFVCEKWYNDASNNEILKMVSDVTSDDVNYLISECPPADVSQKVKEEICMKKNQDLVTVDEIRKIWHKYNQYKVASAYFTCQLLRPSVKDICNTKNSGYNLDYVQKKYIVFSKMVVKKAFDDCKKQIKITPFDKGTICFLKGIGRAFEDKGYDKYRKIYELSALRKVYDKC